MDAFSSGPTDLPSLNAELPVNDAKDANEAPQPPISPDTAPSSAIAEASDPAKISDQEPAAPVESSAGAEKSPEVVGTQPMPSDITYQDVIDLTMDDDDDGVQIVSTPNQYQSSKAIKLESDDETPLPLNQQAPAAASIEHDQQNSNGIDLDHAAADGIEQMQMLQEYLMNQQGMTANGRGSTAPHPLGHAEEPIAVDSDDEHSQATDAFRKLKRSYDAKKRAGRASTYDDIDFMKRANAEDERLQLRAGRKAYREAENQEALFIPEGPVTPPVEDTDREDWDHLKNDPGKSNKKNAVSTFGLDDDDDGDLDSAGELRPRRGQHRRRGAKSKAPARRKVAKDGVRKTRGTGTGRGGSRGRGVGKGRGNRRGINLVDTDALFRHNIIDQATANRDQGNLPGFTSKNKKNALAELIASIPEEQRDLHHGDKVDIEKATRMFNGHGSMRSDGEGGWKLKGMKSSLKNYQLLGAAFLRKREKPNASPRGGLQADEMGLGKTCMMIANIVDGRVTDPNKPKATLIVVPPALITQWLQEVDKHATREYLEDVTVYRAGSRIMSTDPIRSLARNDIVITSYHEVLRSMPRNEPPIHLSTDQARVEWWKNHYEETKGVLHRVVWHRIVLDEAQAIKNHMSKTFEAVDALQARYRWAISGTPIQNSLEEFYAFFRFVRMPDTGSFELFKKNYCKKGSAAALQRLQAVLSKIMCRRTHLDKLFGKPILVLPPIAPLQTIEVEFNPVEAAIYRIIRTRFVEKLRAIGKKDPLEKSYRTIFALLTRLRQLVSSPLLIQKTIKELLHSEDLEKLWLLTSKKDAAPSGDTGAETANALQLALTTVNQNDPSSRRSSASLDTEDLEFLARGPIPQGSLSFQFRKYLQSFHDDGQWDEANKRSLCHACGNMPVRPQITSCMHIYCNACLQNLKYEAASTNEDDATCTECGGRIKKSEAFAAKGFDEAGERQVSPGSTRSAVRKGKKKDEEDESIDWFTVGGPVLQSAKTKGAVKKMEEWWAADKDAKIIIFVQFRGMIKIFQRICNERGWKCAYFHGEMKFDARDDAIKEFSTNKKCKVLIAAMKCGGTGLNLVAANRVIIIDLWWNQCVETQAFCRVFRIGQVRDVEVARFVVKDTVDMDILQMQKRKTAEIESAMDERNRPTRLTTRELLKLFGPAKNPELGAPEGEGEEEPFIMVDDPFEDRDEDVDMGDA